jgi:hypothetical protein
MSSITESDVIIGYRAVLLDCFSLDKVLFYKYKSNTYTYYLMYGKDDNSEIGNIIFDFKTKLYFWVDTVGSRDCYSMIDKYVAIDFRYEDRKIEGDLKSVIGFKVLKCYEKNNKELFKTLDNTPKKTSYNNSVKSLDTITDWKNERTYLKLIKPDSNESFSHYLIGFRYPEEVDFSKLVNFSYGIESDTRYTHYTYWMMIPKSNYDNNSLVDYNYDMITPNKKLIK